MKTYSIRERRRKPEEFLEKNPKEHVTLLAIEEVKTAKERLRP
jgi:hypothetical protein